VTEVGKQPQFPDLNYDVARHFKLTVKLDRSTCSAFSFNCSSLIAYCTFSDLMANFLNPAILYGMS